MLYGVNYAAVFFAALASFFVGWMWYGPLFGKSWMAMMGYTKESMASMKMKPTTAMTWGFISNVVMACVVAVFAGFFPYAGFYGAFKLALLLWLGFVATVTLGSVLWENKSLKLYCFNAAYHFVVLLLMALIIVLWA